MAFHRVKMLMQRGRRKSEHEVDADDAGQLVDLMAMIAQNVGCAAEGAFVVHADIGRHAAADQVIAQTQSQLDRATARHDFSLGIIRQRQADLERRRQDQPVGQQSLILHLRPEVGVFGNVERRFDFEPLRREACHAESAVEALGRAVRRGSGDPDEAIEEIGDRLLEADLF